MVIRVSINILPTSINIIRQTLKKSSFEKVKALSTKFSHSLFYRTEDPFLEYFKVVMLGELIVFEKLFKIIIKNRKDLSKIYETIGFLDSMIAVASFRKSLDFYCIPELKQFGTDLPKKIIFKDAYHPLVTKPVPNSASISKSFLITGSNASGKSTFLKTAAINAILAQTIHTCLARSYSSVFFHIFTSMALKDNIKSKESYYIAEIKSLKRILDSLNPSIPCLCLIDEVLRGTNTIERIAASSEILCCLEMSNCLCIAVTHDIELTSILKQHYENYHFQEKVTDHDIIFDYRLYYGKSHTRNAIKLLRLMGYQDSIVESAEQRAVRFITKGCWSEIGSCTSHKNDFT